MVAGKGESARSMCRKGFGEFAGDHRRFGYLVDGQPVFYTCMSHGGGKDLNDYLIGEMAEDCHLKPREFFALIKCQLSKEEYRRMLIDKGIIKG